MGGAAFTDHSSYLNLFKTISQIHDWGIKNFYDFFFEDIIFVEAGFAVLVKIFNMVRLSEVGMFFTIAFITNTLIVKVFYQFKYPPLLFLLFLNSSHYIQQFNLVRQMLAVAVVFYSLKYVVERNWKLFLLFLLAAFSIHRSSIVYLLFLPFCFMKEQYNRKVIVVLFSLWVVTIPFARGWIHVDSIPYVDSFEAMGYNKYLTTDDIIGVEKIGFKFLYNILILLTFLFYKRSGVMDIYVICFILGGILGNIMIQIVNVYRIQLYFSIAYYPLLFELLSNKSYFQKYLIYSKMLLTLVVLNDIRGIVGGRILSDSNLIGSHLYSITQIFK